MKWKWIFIGFVAVIILFVLIVGGIFAGSYNGLVSANQKVKEGESRYGAALDVCSAKIEGVWKYYNTYLTHETEVFEKATQARANFYKAAGSGNPNTTVEAALAFNLLATQEAYPQLVSAPVAQQSIRSLEESVNEIKTSLDDWIYQTKRYNTQRQSFPTNILGGMFGFPFEYDYYHSEKAKLDIESILK
jgi:LemA protein